MANPQLENGFTRIANEILEALSKAELSGSEFRLAIAILRFTYGMQKKSAEIKTKTLKMQLSEYWILFKKIWNKNA